MNAMNSFCFQMFWVCLRWSTCCIPSRKGTSSSVLGPFHITGAPPLAIGAGTCAAGFQGGEVLLAEGTIRDDGRQSN